MFWHVVKVNWKSLIFWGAWLLRCIGKDQSNVQSRANSLLRGQDPSAYPTQCPENHSAPRRKQVLCACWAPSPLILSLVLSLAASSFPYLHRGRTSASLWSSLCAALSFLFLGAANFKCLGLPGLSVLSPQLRACWALNPSLHCGLEVLSSWGSCGT